MGELVGEERGEEGGFAGVGEAAETAGEGCGGEGCVVVGAVRCEEGFCEDACGFEELFVIEEDEGLEGSIILASISSGSMFKVKG